MTREGVRTDEVRTQPVRAPGRRETDDEPGERALRLLTVVLLLLGLLLAAAPWARGGDAVDPAGAPRPDAGFGWSGPPDR